MFSLINRHKTTNDSWLFDHLLDFLFIEQVKKKL